MYRRFLYNASSANQTKRGQLCQTMGSDTSFSVRFNTTTQAFMKNVRMGRDKRHFLIRMVTSVMRHHVGRQSFIRMEVLIGNKIYIW